MKTTILAVALIALATPALAQAPADHRQHHPGGPPAPPSQSGMPMPMGQMMQGGMMGGGMMGRFSPEDMSAFMDAHIAALKAGLKLSAEQERLWPPVEGAIRNLANLHLTHMQAMRQTRAMMASDPVGLLRSMADHMSQGADAMRKLADAAAPLYSTLDEGQKRRLQVLVRMGSRGMMGGAMMRGGSVDDDDDESSRDNR
jgi:LTXXQ motif family protein